MQKTLVAVFIDADSIAPLLQRNQIGLLAFHAGTFATTTQIAIDFKNYFPELHQAFDAAVSQQHIALVSIDACEQQLAYLMSIDYLTENQAFAIAFALNRELRILSGDNGIAECLPPTCRHQVLANEDSILEFVRGDTEIDQPQDGRKVS